MFDSNYNPSIYFAGKIWNNLKGRAIRDEHGFNVQTRWINYECGVKGQQTGAKIFTEKEKQSLWWTCAEDTTNADMVLVYAEQDDEMRGALVEMGMAMGASMERIKQGKPPIPVYVVGTCKSFQVNAISDVAFMRFKFLHKLETHQFDDGSFDILNGAKEARNHYLVNYHTPEHVFRKTGFLERTTSSFRGYDSKAIAA